MKNAGESLGDRREHLLQWELEVVQAAIKRAAGAREEVNCFTRVVGQASEMAGRDQKLPPATARLGGLKIFRLVETFASRIIDKMRYAYDRGGGTLWR